ncbi:S1C family serine protease [Metabacillus sp. Hm71]|uniref:S1C family serine protease n=1 Tax=Metabacillus sp. Hm71 TaxID=3450743 RepID=UPI003F43349A
MGYYDQDYENYDARKQKGNRGGWFLAGLVGAVIGVLIMLFAFPAISNFLPYNMDLGGEATEQEDAGESTGPVKNVSVNVNTAITDIVNEVSDAVVGVVNLQEAGFWNESGQTEEAEAGTGSGVIYKKEGKNAFIVTNHHVIAGATQIEISLSDGTRIPAEILGSDELTDLAVLRVESDKIKKVAQFGNSDQVKPGEPVIAIGNPLGLQFSGSVTQGIISGTERAVPIDENGDGQVDWNAEVLQTDAAINPGNSGGALINMDGKVIGINSMKIAQEAVEGIGLAIPANHAIPIIEDLEKYSEVRRPYMGISMQSLNEVSSYHKQQTLKLSDDITTGIVVMSVAPMSPAAQAGLQELDVITEFAGEELKDVIELRKILYKQEIGETVEFTYYRGGEKKTGKMRLGEQDMLGG